MATFSERIVFQQCGCVKHKPDLLQRIQFQSLWLRENYAALEIFPRKVLVGMLIKQWNVGDHT